MYLALYLFIVLLLLLLWRQILTNYLKSQLKRKLPFLIRLLIEPHSILFLILSFWSLSDLWSSYKEAVVNLNWLSENEKFALPFDMTTETSEIYHLDDWLAKFSIFAGVAIFLTNIIVGYHVFLHVYHCRYTFFFFFFEMKCVCWNCTWNVCVETVLEMCVLKLYLKCVCWNCTWNVCVETVPVYVLKLCLKCVCWNCT